MLCTGGATFSVGAFGSGVPVTGGRSPLVGEAGADPFAPGYYSILFEDPDGTRLEINHVPGRGLLEPGAKIGGGYSDRTHND